MMSHALGEVENEMSQLVECFQNQARLFELHTKAVVKLQQENQELRELLAVGKQVDKEAVRLPVQQQTVLQHQEGPPQVISDPGASEDQECELPLDSPVSPGQRKAHKTPDSAAEVIAEELRSDLKDTRAASLISLTGSTRAKSLISLTGSFLFETGRGKGLFHRGWEKLFEASFCVIICLNCITIGLEAHYEVQTGGMPHSLVDILAVSEHLFTFIFTVELILRVRALGFHRFSPTSSSNLWNFIDALLVIGGIFFTWIMPVLSLLGLQADLSSARSLTALRAFRLFRLAYVVRKVEAFHEVWVLVRGMSDSFRVLFWTIIVIFLVTYIFAVFGLALVSKRIFEISQSEGLSPAESLQISELSGYLGGLGSMMHSLVQVLTLDSHDTFMRPTMKYIPWSWLYFYAYIAIGVFVLMNLVTAIIVENAVSNRRNDDERQLHIREQSKSQELVHLKQFFALMDSDGDGSLTYDEFQASFSDPDICNKWKLLDFEPEECQNLFRLLDTGDGLLDTDEFFEGLSKMRGFAQSKDVFALRRQLEDLKAAIGNTLGFPLSGSSALGFRRGISPLEAGQSGLREFSVSMDESVNPKNDELSPRDQSAFSSNGNKDSQAEQFNQEIIGLSFGVHERERIIPPAKYILV
ncbi:unnamed protein product [Polarella glacialis]|uniref:EF-hand domain-containing protein n=1 Tax=Polarella glacialis TaxID=89957 RepID=A0A813KQ50_POLGL|nr:unnamed protein product [Polarella glacialis]